jgi:hypothetical protein
MDTLNAYRHIIRNLLTDYATIPYAYGDIQLEPVFDSESDRYLLVLVGRENAKRVHGCLLHIDIINGKLWIQRDGTEQGIANELVKAGIPQDHIVLAFRSAEIRKHTEFAIA